MWVFRPSHLPSPSSVVYPRFLLNNFLRSRLTDKLKTISKGYASFDYTPIGNQPSNLIKLDIKLNGEDVDALSALIHRDKAYEIGKKMCHKLKELIPRQQFDIAIQAAIGAKIVSRETVLVGFQSICHLLLY